MRLRTAMSRDRQGRRRRLWPYITALVVFLAAYPVLVTAALWFGLVEKALASEDLKVEIDNPAWTIWPGRLHLGAVRVYLNGDVQFILSAEEARAHVQLLPLMKRRFYVSSLFAKNVSYRMRMQVEDSELKSPRVAAFPPLEGLPGSATKREEEAEQSEAREGDWTVQVENIDVKVNDLWFMEYHYVGDGRLRGGFLRGPDVLRVDTSVQDLGPGDLRFGEKQLIAKNFRGQVQAEIPKMNPGDYSGTQIFEFIDATVTLDADVQTLEHLGAYFDGPKVKGGAGPFRARVGMKKGALSPKTLISYATKEVGVAGTGFGVKSDWKLTFEVADTQGAQTARAANPSIRSAKRSAGADDGRLRPRLESRADITYVSLVRPGGKPFTIQVHGHEQVATLDSAKISDETKLHSAHLGFPKVITTDLDDLDELTSNGSKLSADSGSAQASLVLDWDEKGWFQGPLGARLNEAKLSFADVSLSGNGRLSSHVAWHPATMTTVLSDVSVLLRDVAVRTGGERVEGWWMNLSSERLRAVGMPPREVTTDLSIAAKDAEPVIEGLAEKDKIPDIVAKLTSLDNLKVQAKLRKRGKVLDVMLDTLESDVIDFSGRVFMNGRQSLLALLVGGEAVSLGIYKRGKETDYGLMAGTAWLNDKLERFPPPEDQVRGQKP